MNANQFSDMLTDITKRFENAFGFQSAQERYDPKTVLKVALICANGKTEELLIDVLEMTTLYLMRGPKISKMTGKMKESGKERLEILTRKYKLKDYASPEEIATGKALSFNKLISAFPYQLLIQMKITKFERPLGESVLNEAKASAFPDFLKTSIFLSVIPFPRQFSQKKIWPPGEKGIKKFKTVVHGVIAYAYLESFVLNKWGKTNVALDSTKVLSNVISVAQNILNSDFISQDMRESNFISMFENDIDICFEAIENLIRHTDEKYSGFRNTLENHFNYDVKTMVFECKAKKFCLHVKR
ncbi:uncharacterized protein LOC117176174 [Belonocnema kinseyi]|uniref:uncharacterized protein LOC117176174 n=1 Tax=Belonocnema kinseyi TaxID=2817044 RepID=UPI00143D4052|nr:uncharacterized protein LOC117176174 [Belonocnema kinseyi]